MTSRFAGAACLAIAVAVPAQRSARMGEVGPARGPRLEHRDHKCGKLASFRLHAL